MALGQWCSSATPRHVVQNSLPLSLCATLCATLCAGDHWTGRYPLTKMARECSTATLMRQTQRMLRLRHSAFLKAIHQYNAVINILRHGGLYRARLSAFLLALQSCQALPRFEQKPTDGQFCGRLASGTQCCWCVSQVLAPDARAASSFQASHAVLRCLPFASPVQRANHFPGSYHLGRKDVT